VKSNYALGIALVVLLAAALTNSAQDKKTDKKPVPKKTVATDPKDAGIDFAVQGEYDGKAGAAQVFALGDGKFDVYFLTGGLPGAGWDGKTRAKASAFLETGKTTATFKGAGLAGTITVGDTTTLEGESEKEGKFTLTRVIRKSPTLGAKPPEGAKVLFDGTNVNEWKEGKLVGDLLGVAATTKGNYKIAKLHVEFVTPFMPYARGQGRGNSGVYVFGREIQVLDSFALEGKNNECGAIYSQHAPLVNMCFPPLSWQTYDVELKTGEPDPKTKKSTTLTVYHNGTKVQDSIPWSASGNIHLQNHGNPVFYRNIWLIEAK
jgi:hypothetical protein